jgi:hypothetical protein
MMMVMVMMKMMMMMMIFVVVHGLIYMMIHLSFLTMSCNECVGATLLGPIKVGKGAHIGACSMVLEDVPPHCVAIGVPAKIIPRKTPVPAQYSPALTMETNIFFFEI